MAIVKFRNLGSIGVIKDMASSEVPDEAWTHAQNIAFRDGIPQKITGEERVFIEPPGSVAEILFYPDPQSGTRYWLAAITNGADTRIYKWDTVTFEDITEAPIGDPYVNDSANGWTSGSVAGVPYFNNGLAAPWVWFRGNGVDLSDPMIQVSTWPLGMTAQQVRPFNNFWILMDITDGGLRNPSRLLWSDPAEPYAIPASFDPSDPTYLAGDIVLGDTADYIMDGLQLRGIMYIYKRNETWAMRPIGGQQLFSFERVFKNTGLLAPRMVTVFKGSQHFMITNDKDVIVHDGNTRHSVADGKVRNYIFGELNEDAITHAFVAPHYQQEEIWFCYPTTGHTFANRAAIFNYMSGAWTFRDLPDARDIKFGIPETDPSVSDDSWDGGPNTTWNDPPLPPDNFEIGDDSPWAKFTSATLLAQDVMATNTDFRVLDEGSLFNGVNYLSKLERIGLTLGDIKRRKEIIAVYPKIQGGPVRVAVGASDTISGKPKYTELKIFYPDVNHKVSLRKNGRYIAIKFEDVETGGAIEPWRLSGYDLDVILRGTH